MTNKSSQVDALWSRNAAEWRDPAQITSQYREASVVDPRLLEMRASGDWWSLLERLGVTLFVTRESDHFALALSARGGRPRTSFFPVPHPSGLVVDRLSNRMFLASTRNPNQVYTLKPTTGVLDRADVNTGPVSAGLFIPTSTNLYPGCLYIHDLALVGGRLCANAVGHNAVVELSWGGGFLRRWWPRCIEVDGRPVFERNHIQLNSIASGKSLRSSFYSASSCRIGRLRPGHLSYKVDHQGVIFSGATREPVCFGLTRPHSARLEKERVWVANSGYGELGYVEHGKFKSICRLPGWTRGLCIARGVAFVATSRVIPRYSRYAPGLDCGQSLCGLHAVSLKTGKVMGHVAWPFGNQIFAIDWIDDSTSTGFVFQGTKRRTKKEIELFYSYLTESGS